MLPKKLNGKESDDQEMNYKNSLVDAQLLLSKNILCLLNEEFNKEIIKGIFICMSLCKFRLYCKFHFLKSNI